MKQLSKWIAATALAVIAGAPLTSGIAHADAATMRIDIRGIVPTICRVEFSQPVAPVSGDTIDLGQMLQFCNNIEGYRIVMQHPAGLDAATFTVDGVEVPLSSSTETVLVDSSNPAFRMSSASLHFAAAAPDQLAALSFRIEPKGAIY